MGGTFDRLLTAVFPAPAWFPAVEAETAVAEADNAVLLMVGCVLAPSPLAPVALALSPGTLPCRCFGNSCGMRLACIDNSVD